VRTLYSFFHLLPLFIEAMERMHLAERFHGEEETSSKCGTRALIGLRVYKKQTTDKERKERMVSNSVF
jgi:hypothetical protein